MQCRSLVDATAMPFAICSFHRSDPSLGGASTPPSWPWSMTMEPARVLEIEGSSQHCLSHQLQAHGARPWMHTVPAACLLFPLCARAG